MKGKYRILTAFLLCVFCINTNIYADQYFDTCYGSITWEEEQLHLDNLAIRLTTEPDSVVYLAYSVGKKDTSKSVERRMKRARKYLMDKRKIPGERIFIVNAGKDDETRIILQPQNKNSPPMKF